MKNKSFFIILSLFVLVSISLLFLKIIPIQLPDISGVYHWRFHSGLELIKISFQPLKIGLILFSIPVLICGLIYSVNKKWA